MSEPRGNQFPFQDAFKYFQINPVTNWERFYNPQFFITYNGGDVSVENQVLREVGSYGKQLGKIIDVLAVLASRLPLDELTPQERRAVDDFRDLSSRVKVAVANARGTQPEGVTASNPVVRPGGPFNDALAPTAGKCHTESSWAVTFRLPLRR